MSITSSPTLLLNGRTNTRIKLSDLYSTRKKVIIFLRHLECIYCHERAKIINQVLEKKINERKKIHNNNNNNDSDFNVKGFIFNLFNFCS